MTKKDFSAIAAIISETKKAHKFDTGCLMSCLTFDIANYCKKENNNFDQTKFYKACEVVDDK